MNHILLAGRLAAHAVVWADGAPRNHGPDFGKASPLGLLVIVLLLIATLLLLRSMNRQLKKVPESFDPEHPAPDQAADEGTDTVEPSTDEETGGATHPPGSDDEPR
ncbi:hypothetical protein [Mycobacterium helveticum]|uniref:Uncharacterized protein n=1 Tax=Mycobacterium helveticum TaxID=2592811 RepID=A0A557XPZ2_9MYCO|nr:hypothetical protein [Mycobacterium helveticum]TVS84945.1 hypothetical protein FPZ46_16115 [Mycobacterium helveticum]TVS87937.1 hypothetical protein FPZ47_14850 [Mycobacterium helveticum]